jgi:hypothetical protein
VTPTSAELATTAPDRANAEVPRNWRLFASKVLSAITYFLV